jgi:hypothetical protein
MNRDLISAEQLKHNKEISAKHNRKNFVPLFAILNSEGKELGSLSGYNMKGEIRYHLKLMKKYR